MLRQRTVASFSLIAGVALAAACVPGADEPVRNRVRILATTDEHSHVLAVAPEIDEWPLPSPTTVRDGSLKGGIARRATVFERERADGIPTVALSNGDFTQGTLSAVAYTVANFDATLMKRLGYDAVALGNHELDLGPAMAAKAVAAAKGTGGAPPFVLTNAIFSGASAADDTLAAIYGGVGSGKDVVSGVLVDKGGVKVGVVSAIGPSAAFDVQFQAAPLTFSTAPLGLFDAAYVTAANTSIAARLQPVIDELRDARGAQVVVLLFHGGLRSTGSNGDLDPVGGPAPADGIVQHLHRVDLVVGGHTHGVPPTVVTRVADADARQVPVVQPAAYGNQVVRVEFVVGDGGATFDEGRSALVAVDDTVPPTANQEIRAAISSVISAIESSVLGPTLQAVTGRVIADDPVVAGDLYFYPLGKTSFDVTGAVLPRETEALDLDTDAMLAVSNGLGFTAEVALQNAGSIRGDLLVGDTGTLGFSDVFRMVSLGGDPWEGTPGFPLVRAYINAMELRAAFEQTLQLSFLNNDYYLGEAGLTITWDPVLGTRCASAAACALGAGWITSLTVNGDAGPIYDPVTYAATGGWAGTAVPALGGAGSAALRRIGVVTPYLVAAFAGNMGVSLYASADPADTTPVTDLSTLVVEWPTTAHVKDHQALARYIAGVCAANPVNPGFLPPIAGNRVVMCAGGVCP